MLIKTTPRQDKNPYWQERGITPNEALETDPHYKRLVRNFARYNRVKSPHRFIEVRVINQRVTVEASGQVKWWDDPLFMEKVFWAFQSPATDVIDNKLYPYYVLEPMECQWIINLGYTKYGRLPVNDPKAAFFVPTECCHHAWNETSGGVSDHIRHRAKIGLSEEDTERKERMERDGKKLLDKSIDAANDPRFEQMYSVLERAVKNGAPTTYPRSGKL